VTVEPLSLERASEALAWPGPDDILAPQGAGAAVYANLVQTKIGSALLRLGAPPTTRIGLLAGDPNAETTEPPLAIVVEFAGPAADDILRELHRLSWNFSHSPTLITIEPQLLRVWSCCEAPVLAEPVTARLVHSINAADLSSDYSLQATAAQALHWINLVSGAFFAEHASRFDRDGRADQLLLSNLQAIRTELITKGLVDDDVCHDLLARVIFVQFLFDRKDGEGKAALNANKLARLHDEGVLSRLHDGFASILSNYDDSYALFDWLNVRFNGDLFPGKGQTREDRAAGWARERELVKPVHLSLLADFISGTIDLGSEQAALWPLYAFDVIPLEFISSIYETFVSKRAAKTGIFYTPSHLVDFILDRVLPWNSTNWDLTILDPACGSGIFLVKSFQRLVHRWKLAHPDATPKVETLRRILERNLVGVDIDPHAVRVASFSLYLAMCDEIEPRQYWSQVVFPPMRDIRLIASDFFAEDVPCFGTRSAGKSFDLVVGNAPWGDNVVTEVAAQWAHQAVPRWTIANNDIGGLFLAKGRELLKASGQLALIQSANAVLFNRSKTAVEFRRQLFSRCRVGAIYNLSALRFEVFKRKAHTPKRSVSPACIVLVQPGAPSSDDRLAYVSPKHLKPFVDEFTIVIEPRDVRWVAVRDALRDQTIWSILMWGGPRDRQLIDRLRSFPTVGRLAAEGVKCNRGVQFGTQPVEALAAHRLFDQRSFDNHGLTLEADNLPIAGTLHLYPRDSTDYSAFVYPQLLVKRSWRKDIKRFEARLTISKHQQNVVCNQSYASVHASQQVLASACLAINSAIATYFLQLVSGRLAAYRPEALIEEVRAIPLPPTADTAFDPSMSLDALDEAAFAAFGLNPAERLLVEDMVQTVIPDFRGEDEPSGERPTREAEAEPEAGTEAKERVLKHYCEQFTRVLKAGFGEDRPVETTIFSVPDDQRDLPYRMIAVRLGDSGQDDVRIEKLAQASLLAEMEKLDRGPGGRRRGLYDGRAFRFYDGRTGTPTIFILKPDMRRHWLASVALEDADEVSLDLFRLQQASQADHREAVRL